MFQRFRITKPFCLLRQTTPIPQGIVALAILRSKIYVFSTLSSPSIYVIITLWMEHLILCHACLKSFSHQLGHPTCSVPLFTQFRAYWPCAYHCPDLTFLGKEKVPLNWILRINQKLWDRDVRRLCSSWKEQPDTAVEIYSFLTYLGKEK